MLENTLLIICYIISCIFAFLVAIYEFRNDGIRGKDIPVVILLTALGAFTIVLFGICELIEHWNTVIWKGKN